MNPNQQFLNQLRAGQLNRRPASRTQTNFQTQATAGAGRAVPGLDKNTLNSLLSIYHQIPTQQAVQQPQTRGRGGTLTSLISEAGGAGGAAAGAATGAALGSVVPGIGTAIGGLAGGILGAFAGGTGGRVIENKVRDNRVGLGDALKEGSLDALFSGVAGGIQAARGAKAAAALSKTLPSAAGAESNLPKMGLLERKGLSLKANAGGFGVGANTAGSQPLSPSKVKEYSDLLKKLKIPANDPGDLAVGIEDRLSRVSGAIDKGLASGNRQLTTKEANSLASGFVKQVKNTPGLSSTGTKYAQEQAAKLSRVKDVKGLVQFRRQLDKFINFNANPDAALAERQGVAQVLRNTLRDKTNSLVPGLADQNNLYHNLSDIQGYVLKAAGRTGRESTSGGGGLFGRVLSSPTANTLKAKSGSKLESFGRLSAGTGGTGSQVARQAKIQAPGNLLEALSTPAPQQSQAQASQDPLGLGMGSPNALGGDLGGFGSMSGMSDQFGGMGQQTASQSPYPLERALADIQRDPKNASTYLNIFKTVDAQVQAQQKALGTGGPNVGKLSAQNYLLAKSGADSLQRLASVIQNDPNVINRGGAPGQGLPVVGGYLQKAAKTSEYKALANNVIDTLLRIRTGAQANGEEVALYSRALVPQAGDPPATVQQKLQQLYAAYQDALGLAYGNDTSTQQDPTDLAAALGYGGY